MPLPVVEYLKLPEDGDPYLEGHKCGDCNSIFLGEREVCSSCTARGKIEPIKLSNKGKFDTLFESEFSSTLMLGMLRPLTCMFVKIASLDVK